MMKISNMDIKDAIVEGTFFVVGVFLYALCFNLFLIPNDLVVSGFSGIAIVVQRVFGWNANAFIYITNGILLVLGFIFLGWKITKKNIFHDIEVFIGNKRTKIKALLDTGNMLKDPITQKPVVVATKRSLKTVLPQEVLEDINNILGGDRLGDVKQFANRIKVIPFKSLGNEHGILIGIKSNKIIVDNNEIKDVIIGIYEKEFSRTKRYDALIGIDLLYEEECNYEFDRKIKK